MNHSTGPTQLRRATAALLAAAAVLWASCDKETQRYDSNLLVNGSFEDVGSDGIPKGWFIENFRGPLDAFEVRYGVDDQVAQDGQRSWFFAGDPNTKRFFRLSQEVEVRDAPRVRIRGWIQTNEVDLGPDQLAQCNFLLIFYDKDHNRFQEMRLSDKRTRPVRGTQLWTEESRTFRLPRGTRYVKISCVFGMTGRAWFDNLSVEVPTPADWRTASTKNFAFHWLPDHPMPEGSREAQQALFDNFAQRLGIDSHVVVNYYFYPDTTTIQRMLSLKGYQYVSWDDVEFHSINANDNHEVIHFMTDPIGRPPRALAEGTVFWLHGEINGQPIEDAMRNLVRSDALPPLRSLFDYNEFAIMDARVSLPVSASLVAFLVDTFGQAKLLELYAAANGMNASEAVAVAIEKVYGVPAQEIEAAWLARQRLRASQG